MPIYNKLVRDKIPEIILADKGTPITRTLDDGEYLQELVKKLKEETAEFEADNNLEELADILEVLNALTVAIGKTSKELEVVRAQKAKTRGAFERRLFLERTD